MTSVPGKRSVGATLVAETLQAPNHAKQKRQVLDAINNLSFKVTAGSVVEKTGLPVLRVTALLNRIAYETQGQLVADSAGGVTYKFAPGFESKYLINGSKNFFRWTFRVAFNAAAIAIKIFSLTLFLLIRISFGLLLIASVVLVVVLIVAAVVGLIVRLVGSAGEAGDLGGDAGDDLLGGLGDGVRFDWFGGIRYWTLDWIWDWWLWPGRYFWWDPWDPWYRSRYDYSDNWGSDSYSENSSRLAYKDSVRSNDTAGNTASEDSDATKRQDADSNFLDNCFSVLFGTGDPNAQREADRWSIVARAIKAKSGVVIAEDLAPYVETEAGNEDWMLPILIRFNGCPEVTESGKFIYSFPSLLPQNNVSEAKMYESADSGSNAASELNSIYTKFLKQKKAKAVANVNAKALPPFIQEQFWTLTGIPAGQVALVVGFACFASAGAIGLLTHASHYQYVLMLRPVLLGIAAYAGLFILMPLMRWPWVSSMNRRIDQRNAVHVEAAQRLAHPAADLAQYLREADGLRRAAVAGEVSMAYTTEEDLLEQEFTALER